MTARILILASVTFVFLCAFPPLGLVVGVLACVFYRRTRPVPPSTVEVFRRWR